MRNKRRRPWVVFLALGLFFAVILPLAKEGSSVALKLMYPMVYRDSVHEYAEQFDVPESLVYAVIHTESHFNPQAVSVAEAKGLMQLTDSTCEWASSLLGEATGDVFDPATNIRYGTKILKVLSAEFSDLKTVLAAYNAGIGNVRRWLQDSRYSIDGKTLHTIPFEETREYVVRVFKARERYQSLYALG